MTINRGKTSPQTNTGSFRAGDNSLPDNVMPQVSDPRFTPAYPTVPFTPGEAGAIAEYREYVKCACGADPEGDDAWSVAQWDGRLTSLDDDGHEELSTMDYEDAIDVCNSCGRAYDHSVCSEDETETAPVLARYDTTSPEWARARQLFSEHNFS